MLQRRYILSADLGEVSDYTALALIEYEQSRNRYVLQKLERLSSTENGHLLEPFGPDAHGFYPRLIKLLQAKLCTPGSALYRQAMLAIDGTGVGRDVCRMVIRGGIGNSGVPVYPFQIRSSESRARQVESGFVQVSRKDLFGVLTATFDARRFAISREVDLWPRLKGELEAVKIKERRREEADAWRTSAHDDMAIALAMGIWLGEKLRGQGVGGIVPVRYS